MAKWTIESTKRPDGTYISKVPDEMEGKTIRLITPGELATLAIGTELVTIFGDKLLVGDSKLDGDTRFGYLAYGFLEDD